ncbi:MAG: hypothetical protein LUC97_11085 [Clostridiales bacterium]|nr:hypothetical protein [Clostridiales bacterium]
MRAFTFMFILAALIFALFIPAELNKNENVDFEENIYITAEAYAETGGEREVFTGFYPEELRGLGSEVYIQFMKNTDELPGDFITLCIGEGVLPYLIIEGDKNIFDLELMRGLAENLGFYNTRAYIELYPIYALPTFNTASYKWFYKEAVDIFKKYAPKTEIIWAMASEYIYYEEEWLPFGADFDYMGISVVLGLNGEDNSLNMWDKFQYLTMTYDYPLIITRFGVTDYSEKSHSYYKNEKEYYITEGLKELPSAYPNIVGILVFETDGYMYEGCENKLKLSNSDENLRLAVSYINEFKERNSGLKKLPFTVIASGERAYITYEDFYKTFGEEYTAVFIEGERFANLNRYIEEKFNKKIVVSDKNRYVIFPENVV